MSQTGIAVQGEVLALVARPRIAARLALPLPEGPGPLLGPVVLVGIRAVGGKGELLGRRGIGLFVARSAHLGVRPALSVVFGVVGDEQACVRLEAGLGFPMETGTLTWDGEDRCREMRWLEGDLTLRCSLGRMSIPGRLSARLAQCRGDGPVLLPARFSGLTRSARATIDVDQGQVLSALAGRHRGLFISSARLVLRPARQPLGRASSLAAPALGGGPIGRGMKGSSLADPPQSTAAPVG